MPDGTTLATAKISELPVAPAANATDKLEASQVDPSLGFVSRSITVGQVATVVAGTLPTTLPPSGAASGDLAGSYPAPTIKASVGLTGTPTAPTAVPSTTNTTQIATTAFVQSALPTTLPGPPTGAAGGGLAGTYPNPLIKPSTTNGDVLTTVAGAAAWAAPTGGGGTATLATGAVGYGSATNVLTGVLADFSWDATQKRLGVGTSTPGALAHFNSATAGTKALIVRGTTTSASQDYFDVILTDPTGGGGSAMRVLGGPTGINPLFQVDRAGDTQVSGWLRVLSTSALVANGADYFGAMLGNGAGGNLGTFAGLGAPTFSTFGSYGAIYLNGSSPGLPYYNSNGTTGWDRLVGESSTQTLSNKTITGYATTASIPTTLPPSGAAGGDLSGTYPNPAIKPSVTNGQVLTTVAGVAAWAAGGGASITVSDTAPGSPTAGAMWWNSVLGTLMIYYQDPNTSQWVPASPSAATAFPGATGGQTFLAADFALNSTGSAFSVLNTGSIGAAGQVFEIEFSLSLFETTGANTIYFGIHDGTSYLHGSPITIPQNIRTQAALSVRATLAAATTFTVRVQPANLTTTIVATTGGTPFVANKASYIKWTRLA